MSSSLILRYSVFLYAAAELKRYNNEKRFQFK